MAVRICTKTDECVRSLSGINITTHVIGRPVNDSTFFAKAGAAVTCHQLHAGAVMLHDHVFPEFLLTVSGCINHAINGANQVLYSGDLVIFRAADRHAFTEIEAHSCELINVAFNRAYLQAIAEFLEAPGLLQRFTAPRLPPRFSLAPIEMRELALQCLRIMALDCNGLPARSLAKAMLTEIFARHFIQEQGQTEADSLPAWLAELCRIMEQPDKLAIGLRAMKQVMPCTQEHLCASFRRYLNMTPTQFINEKRIQHAAKLLSDPQVEIYAAAMDTGFKSLAQFYKLFKQHYGMTPHQYRASFVLRHIPF